MVVLSHSLQKASRLNFHFLILDIMGKSNEKNFSRLPTKFDRNIMGQTKKRNAQGYIKVIVVDEIEHPRFQEKTRQDVSYEA